MTCPVSHREEEGESSVNPGLFEVTAHALLSSHPTASGPGASVSLTLIGTEPREGKNQLI